MKTFTAEEAARIAVNAYAEAVRDMTEEDLLDDIERDDAIHEAIKTAFMERAVLAEK